MITLDISSFSDGSTTVSRQVTTEDVDFNQDREFTDDIDLFFEINKVGPEYFIKTRLQTQAKLDCDRCLEPFDLTIDDYINIIFTPNADMFSETEDDVYEMSDSNNEIDITDSIRQALQIAIPLKHVCDQDCKGLCPHCGTNLNQGPCNCSDDKIDPRWEALKNIKFNS